MRRDVELLSENLPVAWGLVQHTDVVRVFEDVLNLGRGKEILDVLRDPRGHAAPFPETLPYLNAPRGQFAAQKQVELIDVVARGFSRLAVACHAVPNLVLHDQHSELLELLAQLLDVVANDAVVDVYVCAVIEHV